MDERNALIRDLSQPLASGKGWIKFIGIINIIGGTFTALSLTRPTLGMDSNLARGAAVASGECH